MPGHLWRGGLSDLRKRGPHHVGVETMVLEGDIEVAIFGGGRYRCGPVAHEFSAQSATSALLGRHWRA